MKIFGNILILYLCFNLFGANLVSYVCEIQESYSTANMSEKEDANSAEGKEDFGGKEEKFHTIPFYFAAVLFHLESGQCNIYSDGKMVNHSFEINSPPPNC